VVIAGASAPLFPGHVHRGRPQNFPQANSQRDFQAVTGASMLVRRDIFEHVGGFEERSGMNIHIEHIKKEIELRACFPYVRGFTALVNRGTSLRKEGIAWQAGQYLTSLKRRLRARDVDLTILTAVNDIDSALNMDRQNKKCDTLIVLGSPDRKGTLQEFFDEWMKKSAPEGRVIFTAHSENYLEYLSQWSDDGRVGAGFSPLGYIRQKLDQVICICDSMNLEVKKIIPYGTVIEGDKYIPWLAPGIGNGYGYKRLLSWVSVDRSLLEFVLFLEENIITALTPKYAPYMIIVVEKSKSRSRNQSWIDRFKSIELAMSGRPLRYQDVSRVITTWDIRWRTKLSAYLDFPRNVALLYFLLSGLIKNIDLDSFLGATKATDLMKIHEKSVLDHKVKQYFEAFVQEISGLPEYKYSGVNMLRVFEYAYVAEFFKLYANCGRGE
jgi:hypothetical protein